MNQAERPRIRTALMTGTFYVDVQGRATQRVCPTIDRLIEALLKGGARPEKVVIDLRGADWVDSTFAGWLVGVYRRLDRSGAKLSLTGCSDRCVASLRKMSLHRVLVFEYFPQPEVTQELECEAERHADASSLQLMLRAHEELIGISDQNARSFESVVRMLRFQLEVANGRPTA